MEQESGWAGDLMVCHVTRDRNPALLPEAFGAGMARRVADRQRDNEFTFWEEEIREVLQCHVGEGFARKQGVYGRLSDF
jgi:hypothetical protein